MGCFAHTCSWTNLTELITNLTNKKIGSLENIGTKILLSFYGVQFSLMSSSHYYSGKRKYNLIML